MQIPKSSRSSSAKTEVFCNKTAALILVPPKQFALAWEQRAHHHAIDDQIEAIAKRFRVSDETIARRLLDADLIAPPNYERLRSRYAARRREYRNQLSGGGDYCRSAFTRNSHLFTRTVLSARYSGEITVREACHALGVKANNLKKLAATAGLMPVVHRGGDR